MEEELLYAEESKKGRGSYPIFQIHERDPANEPSMQMESMADMEDLDQIGGYPEGALSFVGYKRQLDSRSLIETGIEQHRNTVQVSQHRQGLGKSTFN